MQKLPGDASDDGLLRASTTLAGHTKPVYSVAFHPSAEHHAELLASGSDDNTIRLWDWKAGTELKTLRGHTSAVTPAPAPAPLPLWFVSKI